ncbi:MAG TPA: glycosyltransferase family 4 protein [Thermoanaerobaculia bacterium]|nr:glycosyltransferase family 4 protein [Thermoanaerobaculia bacterium]
MTTAELASTPLPTQIPSAEPVAVLLSRFPTVTETFILREVDEMERQGQRVRLVPMLQEHPPVIHDAALPWTERALYTRYLSLPIVLANLRTLIRRPVRYVSLFLRLVLGTILRPGTLARTVAVFPKSVYLAGQLSREGIRHVHAHFATHPSTMALIIASLSDITFSFTVHAHDIQLDRSLLGWKLSETRFVRSISDFNKRFLEELYPQARGKIVVVHVGIEPETYEASARRFQTAATGVPKVLCVAAHRPYKGLPVLIEACRILKDQRVQFRCDVLGHGPMRDELEQMIRDRGVGDVIHLLGAKPEHVVAEMMGEATLFALPSIIAPDGQMEGIPVVLMEASASGKAVVTTSISGIPELVEHGVTGLLVPPGDAQALAASIRTLLEDPARAREMGRRGQEKVRAEFTLSKCVAQLLARLEQES